MNFEVNKQNVQVLGSGLVFLERALSQDQQQWLANYAFRVGTRPEPKGWYNKDGALNATETRGRLYNEVKEYPESGSIERLCFTLVDAAREAQPKIPKMDLTHMLLLLYKSAEGMGWHRDSDPNDGDNDHPIVSISLGNSSEFGYKPQSKPEQNIVLQSGDVLIWGGPQRMLEHCVAKVRTNTCPEHLKGIVDNARINFTFRSAPNILGKTDAYSAAKFWVDK